MRIDKNYAAETALNTTPFFIQQQNQGIPLPYFIPKTKENYFFYKNGLSHIIPRLNVKVHSLVDECEELWEKFSPKKSVFDEWDFRYAWYLGFQNKLYFYTIYEGKKAVGLIPLWYDENKKTYEWFGSDWLEDNTFLVKEHQYIDLLFKILPGPIYLGSFEFDSLWKEKNVYQEVKLDDPKNIKKLEGLRNMDELLGSYTKKRRYNFRYDVRKIKHRNPTVTIVEGYDEESLITLIAMNRKRFESVSDNKSIFEQIEMRNTFRNIVKNAKSFKTKFIKVEVEGETAAIDLIFEYKNIYYTPIGANNVEKFDGIGSYIMYLELEDAMKRGYSFVDALQEDYGWKHRYFDQYALYKWEKD